MSNWFGDLRVEVDAAPEPGLLRPAIGAALAGRSWPAGPEAVIAQAVAEHVAAVQSAEAEASAGAPQQAVIPW